MKQLSNNHSICLSSITHTRRQKTQEPGVGIQSTQTSTCFKVVHVTPTFQERFSKPITYSQYAILHLAHAMAPKCHKSSLGIFFGLVFRSRLDIKTLSAISLRWRKIACKICCVSSEDGRWCLLLPEPKGLPRSWRSQGLLEIWTVWSGGQNRENIFWRTRGFEAVPARDE